MLLVASAVLMTTVFRLDDAAVAAAGLVILCALLAAGAPRGLSACLVAVPRGPRTPPGA